MGREDQLAKARQAARDKAMQEVVGGVRKFNVFRDECPTCGGPAEAIQKRWCPGAMKNATDGPCETTGQHLHGLCGQCGFTWKEQTANADDLGDRASARTEG